MSIVIKKYGFFRTRYSYTVCSEGNIIRVGDTSSLAEIFEGKFYRKVVFI